MTERAQVNGVRLSQDHLSVKQQLSPQGPEMIGVILFHHEDPKIHF